MPRREFFGGKMVGRELPPALLVAPFSETILENSSPRRCQVQRSKARNDILLKGDKMNICNKRSRIINWNRGSCGSPEFK